MAALATCLGLWASEVGVDFMLLLLLLFFNVVVVFVVVVMVVCINIVSLPNNDGL